MALDKMLRLTIVNSSFVAAPDSRCYTRDSGSILELNQEQVIGWLDTKGVMTYLFLRDMQDQYVLESVATIKEQISNIYHGIRVRLERHSDLKGNLAKDFYTTEIKSQN